MNEKFVEEVSVDVRVFVCLPLRMNGDFLLLSILISRSSTIIQQLFYPKVFASPVEHIFSYFSSIDGNDILHMNEHYPCLMSEQKINKELRVFMDTLLSFDLIKKI